MSNKLEMKQHGDGVQGFLKNEYTAFVVYIF